MEIDIEAHKANGRSLAELFLANNPMPCRTRKMLFKWLNQLILQKPKQTTSSEPFLWNQSVKNGAHVNSIGNNSKRKHTTLYSITLFTFVASMLALCILIRFSGDHAPYFFESSPLFLKVFTFALLATTLCSLVSMDTEHNQPQVAVYCAYIAIGSCVGALIVLMGLTIPRFI